MPCFGWYTFAASAAFCLVHQCTGACRCTSAGRYKAHRRLTVLVLQQYDSFFTPFFSSFFTIRSLFLFSEGKCLWWGGHRCSLAEIREDGLPLSMPEESQGLVGNKHMIVGQQFKTKNANDYLVLLLYFRVCGCEDTTLHPHSLSGPFQQAGDFHLIFLTLTTLQLYSIIVQYNNSTVVYSTVLTVQQLNSFLVRGSYGVLGRFPRRRLEEKKRAWRCRASKLQY